jgi:hypothetical protein
MNLRRLITAPEGSRGGIVAAQTCTGKGPTHAALGQKQTYEMQQPMSALSPERMFASGHR